MTEGQITNQLAFSKQKRPQKNLSNSEKCQKKNSRKQHRYNFEILHSSTDPYTVNA